MENKLLPLRECPFCGCKPKIKPAKKTHCQLHGEPSQAMIVYCDWKDCVAKPMVEAGDIYNGIGDAIYKKEAIEEAIKAWNQRPPTHEKELAEALKEVLGTLEEGEPYTPMDKNIEMIKQVLSKYKEGK